MDLSDHSPRFDFPPSVYAPINYSFHNSYYNLTLSSFSPPGSLQLCSLYIILYLAFDHVFEWVCLPMVSNKTKIYREGGEMLEWKGMG